MITTAQWKALASSIKSGQCTPFLGAGACVPTLPTGTELSRALAAEFGYPLTDKDDLSRVVQFMALDARDAVFPKQEILKRFSTCGYPNFSGNEPHHVLASMPLPVYLTTNYDDFMVKALEASQRKPHRDFCRWKPDLAGHPSIWQADPGYRPSPDQPIVYHLHGCNMLADSMVATEDDYIEFIYNIAKSGSMTKTVDRSWEMLPPAIMTSISNHCLMFIGYRLLDWNFRIIFRWLVLSLRRTQTRLKISVQLSPTSDQHSDEKAQAYLRDYFHHVFDVTVFWGTADQFVSELRGYV